jgi:hypothetical protein
MPTNERAVLERSKSGHRTEADVPPSQTESTSRDRVAIEWLLDSDEPAIRLMTRRDLLEEVIPLDEQANVLNGRLVRGLLTGQQEDGGFGGHPYKKWTGAHWRLVSLVELQVPAGDARVMAACETVLKWLSSSRHRNKIKTIAGLTRRCASQEGNALAVASRVGLAHDERARLLAQSLMEWQWPDGGWNCDVSATGRRSSFHETLAPAWGLHEYAAATGDTDAAQAARRAAELFLDHRLFRSKTTGRVINQKWLGLHYPPYWHYDVLHALLVLARIGVVTDPRANDAFDVLEHKRLKDGRWRPSAYWWNTPGATRAPEAVNWGRGRSNEMITLNALRALKAANRLRHPREPSPLDQVLPRS